MRGFKLQARSEKADQGEALVFIQLFIICNGSISHDKIVEIADMFDCNVIWCD